MRRRKIQMFPAIALLVIFIVALIVGCEEKTNREISKAETWEGEYNVVSGTTRSMCDGEERESGVVPGTIIRILKVKEYFEIVLKVPNDEEVKFIAKRSGATLTLVEKVAIEKSRKGVGIAIEFTSVTIGNGDGNQKTFSAKGKITVPGADCALEMNSRIKRK